MGDTFYDYFKENMEGMGLPAPQTVFGQVSTTVAFIVGLSTAIEKFGTGVTIMQIARAYPIALLAPASGMAVVVSSFIKELAIAFGGLCATYYLAGCLGSLAIATQRSASGGTPIGVALYDSLHQVPHCVHGITLGPTARSALVHQNDLKNIKNIVGKYSVSSLGKGK